MEKLIINDKIKKSRIPARLDLTQSGTGLFLGLFMWTHTILISSILLGKGSFNFVARFMELSFISKSGNIHPSAVFFAVIVVSCIFVIHAALGIRKFPISWKEHTVFRTQMKMLNHTDTDLWYVQVVTAFIIFFLGPVHLYVMLTHPHIDPFIVADTLVSSTMWPLYLVLLFAVEIHATIGLYRLCMKWGWFAGKDPRKSREKLKTLRNRLIIFFISLGFLSSLVFIIIGIGHRHNVGQHYMADNHPAIEKTIQNHESEAVEHEAKPVHNEKNTHEE